MEVASYEIRDHVVILLTVDGKLRIGSEKLRRFGRACRQRGDDRRSHRARGASRPHRRDRLLGATGRRGNRRRVSTSEMLVEAMSEGFGSERIYRVAEDTFREKANGMHLGAALEWLRSPFARRMEQAGSSGTRGSLESYIAGVESAPPSGDRVELLLRLDRASGSSDAAVEMQVAMMKALLQGMYLSRQAGAGTEHAIEQAVEQARPNLHGRRAPGSSCRCISCIAMCPTTSSRTTLLTSSPKTASGSAVFC